MTAHRYLTVLTALGFLTQAEAQTAPQQAQFDTAMSMLQSGRVNEAIPILEELSREAPRAANVYWNLGLAEESVGRFDQAREAWNNFHRLEPDDWRGQEKLIQNLETTGRAKEAAAQRDDLVSRWRGGKDKDLQKQENFCREVIRDKAGTIAVFERFEASKESAALFTFSRQSGPHRDQRIILTTDPSAESKMRAAGRLNDEGHVYILAMSSERRQETYQVYHHLPTYTDIRRDALAALAGTAKPLSSLSVESIAPGGVH
jgi:hypothetical protein